MAMPGPVGVSGCALPSGGLGDAPALQIWGPNDSGGFILIEERQAPPAGSVNRWWALAEVLRDCRAVLVSALGETPREILTESGIMPLEVEGFIDMALNAVYQGVAPDLFKARRGAAWGRPAAAKAGPAGACNPRLKTDSSCHRERSEGSQFNATT